MITQTRIAVAVSLAFANLPTAVYAANNEDQMVVTATGDAWDGFILYVVYG